MKWLFILNAYLYNKLLNNILQIKKKTILIKLDADAK